MSASRLAALSLLSVALLHGLTSGRWLGSGIAALSLAVTMFVPARASLGAFSQIVFTLIAAGAGGTLAWLEAPDPLPIAVLGRGFSSMAVGALFAAAFRAWVRAPEGGHFATFVVGLAALVASGETRTAGIYPAFIVVYILCGFAALRAGDEGRPRLATLQPRGWAAAAASMGIAVAVTVGLAIVLPPLGLRLRDRLLSSLGEPTTGLGERMVLGSLEGMLESDEIVARVYGPPVDYLRGVVYDHYQAGQWAASTTEGTRTLRTPQPASAGPGRVRVMLLGAARTDRYLLPLGAKGVFIPDGEVLVDRFGTVRPARGSPRSVDLDLPAGDADGPPPPGDFDPVPPSQGDLRRPVKLDSELRPLVRGWIAGATTPEAKVDAIAAHLRSELRYSLHYRRGPGDPLLDFLEENREGHCEYFASAMAVLARSVGIPARVVAGYRVSERNELGGYSIVRQRNAHAWVEVHIAGKGWKTVDATPDDLTNRPRATPFFSALMDLIGATWANARERAEAPSLLQIIVLLLVVIAAALALRWWGQRRRRSAAGAEPFFAPAAPPPALVRLEKALAARGHVRAPSETVERFAERLAASEQGSGGGAGEHGSGASAEQPASGAGAAEQGSATSAGEHESGAGAGSMPEAALGGVGALLSRYAALRYGGVGDPAALFAEMDACAARLAQR